MAYIGGKLRFQTSSSFCCSSRITQLTIGILKILGCLIQHLGALCQYCAITPSLLHLANRITLILIDRFSSPIIPSTIISVKAIVAHKIINVTNVLEEFSNELKG